jgi:hypothetical protein
MGSFPSPVIRSARLDLREFGPADAGLVHAVLASGGEPEALPPGAPSDPGAVAGWPRACTRRGRREPAST